MSFLATQKVVNVGHCYLLVIRYMKHERPDPGYTMKERCEEFGRDLEKSAKAIRKTVERKALRQRKLSL